ncbi:MAG: LysR substrate-binding domain-containing protein, partial [Rhodospirillales bacterium]
WIFQLSFLGPVLGRNDIAITLRSGSAAELMAALTSLQIDLVLTNAAPETDALSPYIVQRIDEQPVSLIGVPAQCAGDLGVTELLGERPLILPTKTSGLRVTLDAVIDRLGVKPQIVAEVDDMAMVRLLAREGIGLAVIPPIVVLDELRSGQLVEAGRLTGLGETFYAITMERKFPNPVVRELLQTPLSVAEQPVN